MYIYVNAGARRVAHKLAPSQDLWYDWKMKISFGTRMKDIDDRNGYGYATTNMLSSLARLGYDVEFNDKSADVEIWFDQPHHWNFSPGTYKVGYHPWESTQLMPRSEVMTNNKDWLEIMNQCDEIWTPSPLIAEWYRDYAGITVPVYVYEHGVDPIWTPKKRNVGGTFKFLHVGAEAARKGFKEAVEAFRSTFATDEDVEINCKLINPSWKIGKLMRVNYLNGAWPIEDLIQLYHDNHVFVYPSYGEGFGLNPLQAMATGMPTITVPAWAPYKDFLDPDLSISSQMVPTPFPRFHPGMMLQPNFQDVKDAMRYAYENYEAVEAKAHSRVDELLAHYNWDRLTKNTFDDLAERLSK